MHPPILQLQYMDKLKKILIANRGQIACRILRTAKRLQLKTVAVFSDIDKNTMFVSQASQGFHIGGNAPVQSYLNSEKILQVAKEAKCDAIHPGFGFLSQNATFADQCQKNSIKFIGPSSQAIRKMGSKSLSKIIMQGAGVACVPGYHGQEQSASFLKEQAKKIGFPVLIKAVSGGGGKGMRIVGSAEQFEQSLASCKRESLKSFKDDKVIIEKYITKPRHIQVQIFGDSHGNYVHLFERDCSVQRRHQKVVEQAPSNLPEMLKQEIYKSAIMAARAVKYQNAGTVQFIFDLQTKRHYFMEMNTRLQVQHPISQMITNQDFVEWQLKVADGRKLPKSQQQIKLRGHSIQTRIYAQNPYNNFLPNSGLLEFLKQPPKSSSIRVQTGVRSGDLISIYYDPMIAKLVTFGENRQSAIQTMKSALSEYKLVGIPNNILFLKKIMDNNKFNSGNYDTGFIKQNQAQLLAYQSCQFQQIVTALAIRLQGNSDLPVELLNFRNVSQQRTCQVQASAPFLKQALRISISYKGEGNNYTIRVKDRVQKLTFRQEKDKFIIHSDHKITSREFFCKSQHQVYVFNRLNQPIKFKFLDDLYSLGSAEEAHQKLIPSPLTGKIVRIKGEGQVKKGQILVILEAMKMQHTIIATKDSKVVKVNCKLQQQVQQGQVLIELE